MKTPIALIIFNRPELTKQVLQIISKAKPETLFIISDGPQNKKEKITVEITRNIIEHINWKCKVFKKYSVTNLGCRKSVSSGLNWVFKHTEEAIILEDDCVPDPTFFPYCVELLQKYKDNKKVMMISGNNFISQKIEHSYDFSRHSLIWGWATWKRAWVKYKKAEKEGLTYITSNKDTLYKIMAKKRIAAIEKTLHGKIDTWDYIWQLALLMYNGLCIFPKENLIKNIGFGKDATHTKLKTFHSNLKTNSITFPLLHPQTISVNLEFEKNTAKTYSLLFTLFDMFKQFFQ